MILRVQNHEDAGDKQDPCDIKGNHIVTEEQSAAVGSHKYRHSGHILFTYSGLYPVFEFSADFNDNAAIQYSRLLTEIRGHVKEQVVGLLLDKPSFQGSVKVYIPFNFSSGGWSRGFIPQISYAGSNDLFNKSLLDLSKNGIFAVPDKSEEYHKGKNVYMQTLRADWRGSRTDNSRRHRLCR